MRLDIYFRSCSRVVAFNNTPRPAGMSKAELVVRCLTTLLTSLARALTEGNVQATLTVIDDHSDPDCLQRLQQLVAQAPCPARLISLEATGNGPSLAACYETARQDAAELIYFVEDDYLHDPEALTEMLIAYHHGVHLFAREVAIFPCDYPDWYSEPQVSQILLAGSRYWRVVRSTTCTFMITRNILESHWDCYQRMTRYGLEHGIGEANSINLVYNDHPCLSPMPSLAIHMHEGMYSPFVDWRRWWDSAPFHAKDFAWGATPSPVGPSAQGTA